MAKPIFIIRCPVTWTLEHVKTIRDVIYNERQSLIDEYHVLILHDLELGEVQFQCFNGDTDNEDYQEITKLTRLSIERCLNEENERAHNE